MGFETSNQIFFQVPADWPYFGAVEFEDVTVRQVTVISLAGGGRRVDLFNDQWNQ